MTLLTNPNRPARLAVVALLLLLTTAAGGCGLVDQTKALLFGGGGQSTATPEHLALDGIEEMNRGNYRQALDIFQEIKERYPFSEVGSLAELKAADANFHLANYQQAYILYQEFESRHPNNEAMPYVLFQMGMCHYRRIDTIDRDPAHAKNAAAAFARLNRAFPKSPYREEAEARRRAARDFLARHEMFVASFYVKTTEYEQAQGRLNYLLETYPESNIVPRAEELLAALKAGNPPKRSWRDWLPDISLGSWRKFMESISPMPGAADPNSGPI
ncbi:MAG: outer membrane protein assembly factor BamD [Desulfurivibrio sp.]|nr:outer membrane protein assembly factor BamD [Desulfurivibrio sp.]